MILLDTSAVVAIAHDRDPNHERARNLFEELVDGGEELLVHNYLLVEAVAVLQRRIGLDAARRFLAESEEFHLHWITEPDHREAVALLAQRGRRGLSLVDCASFVVMRRHGITQAFVFDADFEAEGFTIYRADGG